MNDTPTKAADLVTREIAGETLIVPVRRGAVDINTLYVPNVTAAHLWSHIDGKRTLTDFVELLLRTFQIDRATAEADVNDFCQFAARVRLDECGAVERTVTLTQAANLPLPSTSLAYSIAGIGIRLRAAAPDVHLLATATRQVFACSPGPDAEIDLTVDWMSDRTDPVADLTTNGAQLVFDSGYLWRLYREPAGDWVVHFISRRFGARPYKVARLSPTFDRGSVQVDRRDAW